MHSNNAWPMPACSWFSFERSVPFALSWCLLAMAADGRDGDRAAAGGRDGDRPALPHDLHAAMGMRGGDWRSVRPMVGISNVFFLNDGSTTRKQKWWDHWLG